jgi:hypothetical protein
MLGFPDTPANTYSDQVEPTVEDDHSVGYESDDATSTSDGEGHEFPRSSNKDPPRLDWVSLVVFDDRRAQTSEDETCWLFKAAVLVNRCFRIPILHFILLSCAVVIIPIHAARVSKKLFLTLGLSIASYLLHRIGKTIKQCFALIFEDAAFLTAISAACSAISLIAYYSVSK